MSPPKLIEVCRLLRVISRPVQVDPSTPMKNLDDETALDNLETDPTTGARMGFAARSLASNRGNYGFLQAATASTTPTCGISLSSKSKICRPACNSMQLHAAPHFGL